MSGNECIFRYVGDGERWKFTGKGTYAPVSKTYFDRLGLAKLMKGVCKEPIGIKSSQPAILHFAGSFSDETRNFELYSNHAPQLSQPRGQCSLVR